MLCILELDEHVCNINDVSTKNAEKLKKKNFPNFVELVRYNALFPNCHGNISPCGFQLHRLDDVSGIYRMASKQIGWATQETKKRKKISTHNNTNK